VTVAANTLQTKGVRNRPTGRFLVAASLLLVFFAGLFGARMILGQRGLSDALYFAHGLVASPNSAAKMPTSGAIENAWGLRFVSVNVLADGGMIEARYEVVDANKGGRIHRDPTLKDMPVIISEVTGQQVNSHDLLFHIHRGMGVHDEGRAYSIVYGNANFALRPGSLVTIKMSDGLTLQHVPVNA
jgi:hypothetical protein